MSAAPQAGSAFKLQSVRQINDTFAVASVGVGSVIISSIWVSDISGAPKVGWPRSARGFPIAEIADDELRHAIESEILAVIAGWWEKGKGRVVA